MLKCLTAGYSHGEKMAGILQGLPAGIKISKGYVIRKLEERRNAPGRGPRQRREKDSFEIISGWRKGITDGAPICVIMNNSKSDFRPNGVIRPGHADLAGIIKYNLKDPSVVRERASARETAVMSALYAFCARFLEDLDIHVKEKILRLGSTDIESKENTVTVLKKAVKSGNTLGGIFEIEVMNAPIGLGSHIQAEEKISSKIFSALGGINSVKGIEIGEGFAFSRAGGGADAISIEGGYLVRKTNYAGGIEGGMTNGEKIRLRVAVKPPPGAPLKISSFDYFKKKRAPSFSLTSDVTSVFAAAKIATLTLSFVLADALIEKFGGDSFGEMEKRVKDWRKYSRRKMRAGR